MDKIQDQLTRTELSVLIIHPERVIYNGKARAVSSINDRGPFDILALHSNFVSLIKERIVIYELDNRTQEIPIEVAILKVFKNNVSIFVGISEQVQQQPGIVGLAQGPAAPAVDRK